MSTMAFPVKRSDSKISTHPRLDLPEPRIWKPKHLADFFGYSVHWVYKQTASNAEDPPPRIPGLSQLAFDTRSPLFQAWMRRRLGCVDTGESDE